MKRDERLAKTPGKGACRRENRRAAQLQIASDHHRTTIGGRVANDQRGAGAGPGNGDPNARPAPASSGCLAGLHSGVRSVEELMEAISQASSAQRARCRTSPSRWRVSHAPRSRLLRPRSSLPAPPKSCPVRRSRSTRRSIAWSASLETRRCCVGGGSDSVIVRASFREPCGRPSRDVRSCLAIDVLTAENGVSSVPLQMNPIQGRGGI